MVVMAKNGLVEQQRAFAKNLRVLSKCDIILPVVPSNSLTKESQRYDTMNLVVSHVFAVAMVVSVLWPIDETALRACDELFRNQ